MNLKGEVIVLKGNEGIPDILAGVSFKTANGYVSYPWIYLSGKHQRLIGNVDASQRLPLLEQPSAEVTFARIWKNDYDVFPAEIRSLSDLEGRPEGRARGDTDKNAFLFG